MKPGSSQAFQGDVLMNRRRLFLSVSALSAMALGIFAGRELYINGPSYALPYSASFAPDVEDLWTALGGTWEVANASVRNDSNDLGAKLLTGSASWKDYVVEGDLQLLGVGSVGVLARVRDAELGENSFRGYFAGIRAADNALVLGAYDFAYHEAAKARIPQPVRAFQWYHIKLRVDGCQITASAWTAGMREVRTAPVNDPDCFKSGSIGLRSNGTGGVWRNITVVPINRAAGGDTTPQHVLPEDVQRTSAPSPGEGKTSYVPAQPVASLQYLSPFGSPVASVRGSVVLTRPALFVEDSTGGVEAQFDHPTQLKNGDEVEVTGEVNLDKFSPVIRKAQFRVLREAVPILPMVLTANQVASGAYDGRFVQVDGFLRAISEASDGTVSMELYSGTQSFHAVLPLGRSRWHVRHAALESRLRLRGVSVVDAKYNKASDPFVVLVRSAEDIDILAGPPWWRPSTLILIGLIALALIFAFNHLYLLAKHWRLRAVAQERERLADEIHDTLAQSFAGIGFQLQAIRNSVPPGAPGLETQVDLAMSMARTSHEEARRSIANLRPEPLGPGGLLGALGECARRMVKNGDLRVETYGDDSGRTLPSRTSNALYRIGHEAIANAIRHAHPGTIKIGLQRTTEGVCLSVEDDGDGFIADGSRSGFGLPGMRKRAESISGTLTVVSAPAAGTRVEVKAAVGHRFPPRPWLRPPSHAS
jgi:signal transduction histidine kinase